MPKITLKQIRSLTNVERFGEGESLYQAEALTHTSRDGHVIRTSITDGGSPIQVEAQIGQSGIVAICSCGGTERGHCEHVVALLLAYLYEPEIFTETASTALSDLMSRSKEELVVIIQAMLAHDPSLQDLLTPSEAAPQSTSKLVDLSRYTNIIAHAFNHLGNEYDSYCYDDNFSSFDPILNALAKAAEFGSEGNWHNALALYNLARLKPSSSAFPPCKTNSARLGYRGRYILHIQRRSCDP